MNGSRRHRRTLAQRGQDERGRWLDCRPSGIQLDGDEDHAIWPRRLLDERRSVPLRD